MQGHAAYTVQDGLPTARDLHTGELLWQGTDPLAGSASNPVLMDDRIVIGTADGLIRAFAKSDGTTLWEYQTGLSLTSLEPYGRDGRDVNSTPAIHDGIVYIGASDGRLHGLSLATGEKLITYQLGTPIASSPTIHEDTLYVGAYDGNLYAFRLGH